MSKKIIVYSHGFGVRKDDRGLFTDITASLPAFEHVLFDYNQADDEHNTLTATPLNEQAELLKQTLQETRQRYPGCEINLVCHSQGCVVAAMLQPEGIQQTLFLAPPAQFLGTEAKLKRMSKREGTIIKDETVSYPRRDGSTTIVPKAYWQSREGVEPIPLYNQLAQKTALTVINADHDEVLESSNFGSLAADVKVVQLAANHDFTDDARQALLSEVNTWLNKEQLL